MADQTFYFYDLETTGADTRSSRIMQFAGQRTDMDLNPVGEPDNILVKLSDDILPDPRAVLVHKITPQQAQADGITELELFRYLIKEVFTENTIVCGFNNIRFDDELMRFGLWRNFLDPYEWAYKDGRSRWDVIDLARMTRALRPDGIEWPIVNGKPTNKLEELAKANGLLHENAHDALSDVLATIELAKLIKTAQPKLFDHYLGLRDKRAAADLFSAPMLVHTSGMLSSSHAKTTVVAPLGGSSSNASMMLAFDLRHNPSEYKNLSAKQIHERLFSTAKELKEKKLTRLPVKGIYTNKSPAIAPLGVLDDASWERIGLTLEQVEEHRTTLTGMKDFIAAVHEAHTASTFDPPKNAEVALYESFVPATDKRLLTSLNVLNNPDLFSETPPFSDDRLQQMWPLFKARNAPELLSDSEKESWDAHRRSELGTKGASCSRILQAIGNDEQYAGDDQVQFLLEEMSLYLQSVAEYDYE